MKVSVIVISKNHRAELGRLLQSLAELKAEFDFEIVVVEATEEDDLAYQGVKYIKIPVEKSGFGRQRNIGVKSASGELILFVDDDVVLTPGWYSRMLSTAETEARCLGVMGAVFPLQPSLVGFCEGVMGHPGGGFRLHHSSRGRIFPLSQVATVNTIIRKSVIEEVGGFDERLKYGSEDSDISIRITQKYGRDAFRYDPGALVYHLPRNRIDKIIPWYIRRGKADADLVLKHRSHRRYFFSSSILLKIIPLALLSWVLETWWIIAGAFVLWWSLQIIRNRFLRDYGNIVHFSRAKTALCGLLLPGVKFTADLMFDLGRILRLVRKR